MEIAENAHRQGRGGVNLNEPCGGGDVKIRVSIFHTSSAHGNGEPNRGATRRTLALLLYSLGAVQALHGAFAHLESASFGRFLDGTEHELSSSLIQLKS